MKADSIDPVAVTAASPGRGPMWLLVVPPLILLAGLIVLMLRTGPADALKPVGIPTPERLAFTGVVLTADGIIATVLNDGPDRVRLAQVQVDDAYWQFTASPTMDLAHLQRTTLTIPYPWVEGETHHIKIVTSTGTTFDHEIPVAAKTPRPGFKYFAVFALIGLYVGVIPVAIGLLWFPMVARMGRTGLEFVLALTVGLLVFLMVDASAEGLEAAHALPGSYQGVALLVFAASAAYAALAALGTWLKEKRRGLDTRPGMVLALLIATGIGLHNFGEGLAIGGAFALGETVLGGLLIMGFALHNTTEGLAIVAPLARASVGERSSAPIGALIRLGFIGGAPTIVGAWIGGFVYSPLWALVFLGLGIGAIAQVVIQVLAQISAGEPLKRHMARGPVLAGLFVGFAVMYATGMLIG